MGTTNPTLRNQMARTTLRPRDKKLREDISEHINDTIAAGHPGHYKTQELITETTGGPIYNPMSGNTQRFASGVKRQRSEKARPCPITP